MKKLDLICYLLIMVGVVSCSNETTDNLNEDLIIGTWKPDTVTFCEVNIVMHIIELVDEGEKYI